MQRALIDLTLDTCVLLHLGGLSQVECNVCQTLLHMTGIGNQTADIWFEV